MTPTLKIRRAASVQASQHLVAARLLAIGLMTAGSLTACRPATHKASAAPQSLPFADTTAAEQGYVAPPRIIKADVNPAGVVMLAGTAVAKARIQLQSPEGESRIVVANNGGAWAMHLPAVVQPRMFALSEIIDGGRVVHAEGALIVLPRPAPAALLARAGFGSLILQHAEAGPSLTSIDYDPGGFAAFSGTAQPGATVRLSLDGAPAGLAQADDMGCYAVLAANHRLSFGRHSAVIQTGAAEIRRVFNLVQPDPLTSPYQASAAPDGWRIEWAASGSVQTTLVLASK